MTDTDSNRLKENSEHRISIGGSVDRVKVSLRIFGDELDPVDVSRILQCEPTSQTRKGEIIVGRVTGNRRIAPLGSWLLESAEDESVDLEEHILKLLSRVSCELEMWKELTQKYNVDLFCGLFLEEQNRGFSLSPRVLKELSERNLNIRFDIYA